MTTPLGLSHTETAFVDALIEVGDTAAAAAIAGTQPSVALDPRIQSAIVERIRQHGPSDAAYARRILRDLAQRAENEGIRYRAATTLWERGLGKVPDTIQVDISIQHVSRAALYAEIRSLIDEVGLPPAIEGEFEELPAPRSGASEPEQIAEACAEAREEVVQHHGLGTADKSAAGVAQRGKERPSDEGEVAGSTPAAGTSQGRPPSGDRSYVPELPTKWK